MHNSFKKILASRDTFPLFQSIPDADVWVIPIKALGLYLHTNKEIIARAQNMASCTSEAFLSLSG